MLDVPRILQTVQRSVKPLAFHVEAQHIPRVHNALKRFLREAKEQPTLFCITPVNKAYVEGMFGPVNSDYSAVLKLFYQQFSLQGYDVQLHVHLTRVANMLSLEEKHRMVREAYGWMMDIGVEPTHLCLGWFAPETGLDGRHRLKLVDRDDYRVIHDYKLVGAK